MLYSDWSLYSEMELDSPLLSFSIASNCGKLNELADIILHAQH